MSAAPRLALLVLLFAGSLAAASDPIVPKPLAPFLDAGADQVIARGFVPSEAQKVGEVRLVRRGDCDVVETLLYTKVLSRVVSEIRKKELANWPAGTGHDDALRYADALEAVRKQIWDRMPRDEQLADRRQKLWIDFVLGERVALVAIGTFEMDGTGDAVTVRSREPLALLEPSRAYVRRNMRLIAADSFHVDESGLVALLTPLPLLRDGAAEESR
jgi:hypothetical protein